MFLAREARHVGEYLGFRRGGSCQHRPNFHPFNWPRQPFGWLEIKFEFRERVLHDVTGFSEPVCQAAQRHQAPANCRLLVASFLPQIFKVSENKRTVEAIVLAVALPESQKLVEVLLIGADGVAA